MFRVCRVLIVLFVIPTVIRGSISFADADTGFTALSDIVMEDQKPQDTGKIILGLIQEGFKKMIERIIAVLKTEETEMTTTAVPTGTRPQPTTGKCIDGEGIIWDGKCFWVAMRSRNREMTFSKSKGLCRKNDGTAANIYNEKHYQLTMKYLRSKIPADHTAFKFAVWTGMTFDVRDKQIYQNNGDKTSYVTWYPDPQAPYVTPGTSGWTQIGTDVDKDADDAEQGMLNSSPYWNKHAVYCEKDFP